MKKLKAGGKERKKDDRRVAGRKGDKRGQTKEGVRVKIKKMREIREEGRKGDKGRMRGKVR